MKSGFNTRHVYSVLLCQSVVPAAVPDAEKIGVLLNSTGQLRAGEFLDIDIAVRIGIILQFYLCMSIWRSLADNNNAAIVIDRYMIDLLLWQIAK